MLNHLKSGLSLFGYLDKVYSDKRFKRRKLNASESLKQLETKFNKEVKSIYEVISNFRQGLQSFETFTIQ